MRARESTNQHLADIGYGRMIRALNDVHYAGETSFYGTAPLRPCEERLFEQHGRSGRILDVGCGAGRVTRAIAARGGDIVGIDINESAIDIARTAAPGVTFIHGSMTDLPLQSESITHVWCLRFSFNALPTEQERVDTLGELWRVCALGGTVLIEAFNWYHNGRFGLMRAANLLDHLARTLSRWGGGRSLPLPSHDILYLANKAHSAAPGYAHLTTARELDQLVRQAGISTVATVTSEASLLDGSHKPIRPRHGRYSMWLVLRKPGSPS